MYRGFIAALSGGYRASARLGLAYRTSLKVSRPLGSIRLYLLPRGRQSLTGLAAPSLNMAAPRFVLVDTNKPTVVGPVCA
jgi:hypothetical protein